MSSLNTTPVNSKTTPPFLVVSYSIPTRTSGTPVVIRNFLENFMSNEVVLIGRPVRKQNTIKGYSFHYRSYKLPTPPIGTRGEKLWRFLSVFWGVLIGMWAIRVHKLESILAFYMDESSLLIGYILHKLTKSPFYAYFCDLYLENFPIGIDGKFAKWLQPRIFRSAKKIFVLTEAMKDYFKEQYQLDSIVLPHCLNQRIPTYLPSIELSTPLKIGYLGSIFIDRKLSLKQLCAAINNDDRFELIYFTSHPMEFLKQEGLLIPNSTVQFIPYDHQLLLELRKCDVLFIPAFLSDDHKYREAQLITGFPTKSIEYLLSLKTILVHCKASYFTAKFFKKFKCGYIVDGGVEDILQALQKLREDYKLRAELSNNAMMALAYFDGSSIANVFRNAIKSTD